MFPTRSSVLIPGYLKPININSPKNAIYVNTSVIVVRERSVTASLLCTIHFQFPDRVRIKQKFYVIVSGVTG